MTITAKYQGKCSECGEPIAPGQTIDWDRSSKRTSHVDCDAAGGNERAKPAYQTMRTRPFGEASDQQRAYLGRLLERLERVEAFDPSAGDGQAAAEAIRAELGNDRTRERVSSAIEDALSALDDAM